MSAKEKIILIGVIVIPLLLLFSWIFFNSITDKRTGKEVYLDMVIDKKCEGIVDSIYRQEMNHNVLALKTKDCIFEVEPEWEKKFEIGDSISKRKGELYLKYYRNDRLVEVLNYEDLNRK